MKTPLRPITIDATNQPLGRLASRVAFLLQGKHRVETRPQHAPSQRVIIKHCAKVRLSRKNKLRQKLYYRTSGHPGGLRAQPMGELMEKDPSAVVRRTVQGMLPNNKLRRSRMLLLEITN